MTLTPTGTPPAPPATAPAIAGWREVTARVRGAATTEPGRLRIMAGALALLVVLFGAVTAMQVSDRSSAADDVATRSQPLSAAAAEIYRSLADANTTEAAGFLADGQEPTAVATRYRTDIRTAARLITAAASSSSDSPEARAQVTLLNEQLPVYSGLVQAAIANNRQNFPLGGAYLRYANDRMTTVLLPAAQKLYKAEQARLGSDYGDAKSLPLFAWFLGLLTLGALGWAQSRTYRRTNRVFNHGLLAATLATLVVLVWLVAGHTVARLELDGSVRHGATSLQVLNRARIDSLQASGNENLTLVSRGASDTYETAYRAEMTELAGADARATGGLLKQALADSDDPGGRDPVQAAADSVRQWRGRHGTASAAYVKGDYRTAVADVVGGRDARGAAVTATTEQSFDAVDGDLKRAIAHETGELQDSVSVAGDALTGLPAGAALLGLLGAAGAVFGVNRRLSEYR